VTPGESPTVIVVDDEDAVRDSLLFLLDVEGLPARGFASAEAFLAAAPKPTSGCIITDLWMPGLDGADLLRLLPLHGIDLPVIMITGHGDSAAAARVLAAGAFDFIEKPFQHVAILEAVRAALAVGLPDQARDTRARETGERIARLPRRERTLLNRLVLGDSNREVADKHRIAIADAERMRASIMQRFGAASLSDLIRLVAEARRYAARTPGSL